MIFCTLGILLIAAGVTFSCAVVSVMASKNRVPITGVQTDEYKVSLTVNLYENTDADYFVKCGENVGITFFISEAFEARYPEKIKELSDSGHAIGILADNLKKKSRREINDILASRLESLSRITGKNTRLLRFDYNLYDNNAVKAVLALGLFPIQWAADDSSENFSAGDIILLTSQRDLKEFISKTAADGFKFDTVDELIYKDDYKIDLRGVQVKE